MTLAVILWAFGTAVVLIAAWVQAGQAGQPETPDRQADRSPSYLRSADEYRERASANARIAAGRAPFPSDKDAA